MFYENFLPTTSRHISLGLQFFICIFCFKNPREFKGVVTPSWSGIVTFCAAKPEITLHLV